MAVRLLQRVRSALPLALDLCLLSIYCRYLTSCDSLGLLTALSSLPPVHLGSTLNLSKRRAASGPRLPPRFLPFLSYVLSSSPLLMASHCPFLASRRTTLRTTLDVGLGVGWGVYIVVRHRSDFFLVPSLASFHPYCVFSYL